jgi:hypothetical protein
MESTSSEDADLESPRNTHSEQELGMVNQSRGTQGNEEAPLSSASEEIDVENSDSTCSL